MKDICLIVPAFNEGKVLARTIRSAHAVAGVGHVYVVNDGSTDNTREVARLNGAEVLTIPNSGKAGAIRAGMEFFHLADRYDWIGILDADSFLDPGYLDAMRAGMVRYPEAAILCGAPRSAPHNWLTAYRAVEYAVSLGVYREAQHLLGTINVAPGCASLYRSSVLRTLDLSGDTLVEDMDLTMQVQRRGEMIVYVPEAHVITQDPPDMTSFVGQISRWYRGTWQIVRKHRLMRRAQLIDLEMAWLLADGLAFAALLCVAPAIWFWHPYIAYSGLALDQAMMLVFTLLVARGQRRWDVIAAFPLFSIPRLANAFVFAWAFAVTRRPLRRATWYSVGRY